MESLKVSVIIPTFNQTTFLERAIISVTKQSFKNIEVIVIDDNTELKISNFVKNVVEKYHCNDIKYYKNKKNVGSVKSRNTGISCSTGDFITFLDDDDYYTIDKVKKQVEQMKETNSLYSVCNITLEYSNGKKKYRPRAFLNYNENLLTKHFKYHIAGTSTFMFEANFLKKLGGFENLDFGDDFYLMEKAIMKSDKFTHLKYDGVHALVNTDTGLSSSKNKIIMENELYKHKEKKFDGFKKSDIRYIKMRHHSVKAYFQIKDKIIFEGIKNLFKSLTYSPIGFFSLIRGRDY